MGSLWRSEDMILLQLLLQKEAVHDTVSRLGELGFVQFRDLSQHLPAFSRKYAPKIKELEVLDQHVRYFEELFKKKEYVFDILVENDLHLIKNTEVSMEELESEFEKKESELKLLTSNLQQLEEQKASCEESLEVIQKAGPFINSNSRNINSQEEEVISEEPQTGTIPDVSEGFVGFITGCIMAEKLNTFQMLLYRATRGNMILKTVEASSMIYDPFYKKKVEKIVFVVFFTAKKTKEKITKICETIGASIHDYPRQDIMGETQKQEENVKQLIDTIDSASERYRNILSEISSKIDRWKKMIAIEKVTFDIMNKFDYRVQGSAIAQCWLPKKKIEEFKKEITLAEKTSNVQVGTFLEEVQSKETPPTYFETNKVTAVFQDMVNAYAIPSYKEINPAPITMVTFPFLFAVMFGDIGHAIMLFLFSLGLVVFEKPLKKTMESNEMLIMLYQGRYLLLMMGTLAIYTGFLYNDCFGFVLNLFGSRYTFDGHGKGSFSGRTYEFGVDPAWYETTNKLLYYNSVKMKMAVVFGVLHMLIGIILKFLNFLHFRKYAYIFMEAIPEFLILSCSFGYLSFMIIFKWCIPWIEYSAVAPDLLQTMTNFFLHPFDAITHKLYGGQEFVQITLLLIFAGCIPLLLFPGTIYEIAIGCSKQMKKRKPTKVSFAGNDAHGPDHSGSEHHDDVKSDDALLHQHDEHSDSEGERHHEGHHEEEEEEFNVQETVIHHIIHTIEFTLNSVSNTASYLRLWALSLAHAQLSEVFFQLTVKLSLSLGALIGDNKIVIAILDYSGIPVFLAYTLWILLSIGVLLMMETLSAFLHSLRLHWVEFQSKFYGGQGHLFEPLSFEYVMKQTTVDVGSE
eukprot:gene4645-8218_t